MRRLNLPMFSSPFYIYNFIYLARILPVSSYFWHDVGANEPRIEQIVDETRPDAVSVSSTIRNNVHCVYLLYPGRTRPPLPRSHPSPSTDELAATTNRPTHPSALPTHPHTYPPLPIHPYPSTPPTHPPTTHPPPY